MIGASTAFWGLSAGLHWWLAVGHDPAYAPRHLDLIAAGTTAVDWEDAMRVLSEGADLRRQLGRVELFDLLTF